jgi:hypothetical protein
MRFYEFKLPDADSSFAKELESYLLKLINSAKKLPETDPKRQEFDAELGQLQAEAGIKEDNIEDADTAIVSAVVSKLLKEGEKNALFKLMDLAKIVKDPSVQAALKNKESQIAQREKSKVQEISKAKIEKAKAVAAKVGKPADFGRDLLGLLDRYENDQLTNDFMDLVISGKALTTNIVLSQPISKFNLRSIINPKLIGILDNPEAFRNLALMPFAEQKAGFGGGVGPGEAMFAMLIPKAKRAPSGSDLEIDGKIWEIKGGGSDTSKAWLDSASVSPNELRGILIKHTESLGPQFRKKIRYSDGEVYRLSEVIKLADFRDNAFKHLRVVFRFLDSSNQKKMIDGMYELLFPGVKKQESKLYSQYVRDSINSILEGNRRAVADIQAKLGMLEYAIGKYQAENFIIYNYVTQELIMIRGIQGIIDSIDNKDNMIKTETITLGGSKKSSAGVTLISKPSKRAPKPYD